MDFIQRSSYGSEFWTPKLTIPPLDIGTRLVDYDPRMIFLLGIPTTVTQVKLHRMFSKYGSILEIQLILDGLSKYSRGSAFILFDDVHSIRKAKTDSHSFFKYIDGAWVRIVYGLPRKSLKAHIFNTVLFVKGIPDCLTKDELKDFFSQFGKVVGHEIVLDCVTKRSRGIGFVVFDKEEVIDRVLANVHHVDVNGTRVLIRQAIPKWGAPSTKGLIFPRVLALTHNHRLADYGLFCDVSYVLTESVRDFCSFSISEVVGDRYIFVVLSDSHEANSKQNVFFYDICKSTPYSLNKAPGLGSDKFSPTLIAMGSKLFAFPSSIYIVNKRSKDFPQYKGEVLETSSKCENWTWIPLPCFPKLPSSKKNLVPRSIVAFAIEESRSVLHLSLGEDDGGLSSLFNTGDLALIYYADYGIWGDVSFEPLPFLGEGKFVGDVCYGFPCGKGQYYPPYLACYKLKGHCWVELRRHLLLSGSFPTFHPCLQHFYVLGENIISIIRVRPTLSLEKMQSCHFLEVDVVELLRNTEEEEGSTASSRVLCHVTHQNNREFRGILGVRY